MVSFRKIFILQLVGLVLTYNFTDCNFENIRNDYQAVIFSDLKPYINGCTHCDATVGCEDPPGCLTEIERLTFHPTRGCTSLGQKSFAKKTKASLSISCPGYPRRQMNNTQAMKKKKKREDMINECQKIVSNLIGLWGRFNRF